MLRRHFTQGRVDKMLAPTKVSYTDIAAYLRQGGEGIEASVLHTFFVGARSETLIARWLAEEESDAAIAEKEAKEELFTLIESRLGLAVPTGDALAEARAKVVRHVLVNEFRSDLEVRTTQVCLHGPVPTNERTPDPGPRGRRNAPQQPRH